MGAPATRHGAGGASALRASDRSAARRDLRIGVDVGGTNTDAVLMKGLRVICAVKRPTTPDVVSGVVDAIAALGSESSFRPAGVRAIMVGTTQFANALAQREGLDRVEVVRLAMPATSALPPFTGWPAALRSRIEGTVYMCRGGYEFDGRPISSLDEAELRAVGEQLRSTGARAIAVCGVFSPINPQMEEAAAAILHAAVPDAEIAVSHEIGRLGLLERENATILNASLQRLAKRLVAGTISALGECRMNAPLYFTQNDGTLIAADRVVRYPVMTINAGPTNSMRGAAILSSTDSCVVIDVGGTTTDIGAVVNGFPREAMSAVVVAGVRTNFRMPDLVSLPIGGGSVVAFESDCKMGPHSVGFNLGTKGYVFGGQTLTATDLAVRVGRAEVGDPTLVGAVDGERAFEALRWAESEIGNHAETMRSQAGEWPLVIVGGGSILLSKGIEGFAAVIKPPHYEVANAVGAACARVGGHAERVFAADTVGAQGRATLVAQTQQAAVDAAAAAGARLESIEVVEMEEAPMAYIPGDYFRLRVRAVGDLELAEPSA